MFNRTVTNTIFPYGVTIEAIAQGGSGQTSLDPGVFLDDISTALPDKAYATTLIGGASNVAEALLGPGDDIFGTSILSGPGSSTFDFSFRGDLILGVIDGEADIIVNGAELSAAGGDEGDAVFYLGSFGPNIDLTITGFGDLCRWRRGSRGLDLGNAAAWLRRPRVCRLSANARAKPQAA